MIVASETESDAKPAVCTLLCHRDMEMASWTIPGILRSLDDGQQFFIFGDGSLTSVDCENLAQLDDRIVCVTRAAREELVSVLLQNHPRCISYRDELPLAFKLLDVPLYCQSKRIERIVFTDTDIVYGQNCAAYFLQTRNTHLRTDAIKLSVRTRSVLFKYGWKVPYQFNSGYFSYGLDKFDLDFIEHFLGLPDVRGIQWLSEQTCWGLLFAKAGTSFAPNRSQFACREDFAEPSSETLAIHLIADLKGKARELSEGLQCDRSPLESPKFEDSRNVNIFDWFFKSVRRLTKK